MPPIPPPPLANLPNDQDIAAAAVLLPDHIPIQNAEFVGEDILNAENDIHVLGEQNQGLGDHIENPPFHE